MKRVFRSVVDLRPSLPSTAIKPAQLYSRVNRWHSSCTKSEQYNNNDKEYSLMLKKTLTLATLILPLSTTAAIVPVNWIGVVSSSTIAGTVDIGDTITGHYSYDDSSSYGSYSDAVTQQYDTNHDSSFSGMV